MYYYLDLYVRMRYAGSKGGDAKSPFDWDEANTEHVLAHDVTPEEAEEAYSDPARKPAPAYTSATGEHRRALLGITLAGRMLFVVYTIREHAVRIISARNADAVERRRYRSKKGRT
jgi:uncharacterized DUF497 family protein